LTSADAMWAIRESSAVRLGVSPSETLIKTENYAFGKGGAKRYLVLIASFVNTGHNRSSRLLFGLVWH